MTRLASLYDIGGLDSNEQRVFDEALWSRIEQTTNLPGETNLHDFAFLHLPSPDPEKVKERFRQNLISKDFTRVIARSTTSDGKQGRSVSFGGLANSHIEDWIGATALPLRDTSGNRWHYLEWSADEIKELLQKAVIWWDDERADVKEFTSSNDPFFSEALKGQFTRLITLLAHVILPRLNGSDSVTVNTAMRLLREMEENGLQTQPALPCLLFLTRDLYDEVVLKLRVALHSSNENAVSASILGTYHWLLYNAKSSLVAPPTTLLDELRWIIVLRRQPGLDYALRSVALSVKHFPELFNENHLDELCQALEGLDVETQSDGKGSQQSEDRFEVIERYERPRYRKLVAELAYDLTIELTRRNKDMPQILHRWQQIAETDELPLVRNVWLQSSLEPARQKHSA